LGISEPACRTGRDTVFFFSVLLKKHKLSDQGIKHSANRRKIKNPATSFEFGLVAGQSL